MRSDTASASAMRPVDEDDCELVAAQAADRAGAADRGAEDARDLGEDVVAAEMAVLVVDALEVVEVEQDE